MENDIRVKRAEERITQKELAAAVGVTRQTIYAIEHSRYDPSLNLAFKLASYFGCSVEELFTPEFNK